LARRSVEVFLGYFIGLLPKHWWPLVKLMKKRRRFRGLKKELWIFVSICRLGLRIWLIISYQNLEGIELINRYYYVTPTSYLELLNTFKRLHE
jgi:hypothetical protein